VLLAQERFESSMTLHGITALFSVSSELDPGFLPLEAWTRAFLIQADQPLAIVIRRDNEQRYVYHTKIISANTAASCFYIERMVKFLLWAAGGYEVTICGSEEVYRYIHELYRIGGKRGFDAEFMASVYRQPFAVLHLPYSATPAMQEHPVPLQRSFSGYRIGFDAGGSDRKVSAVIDGEVVFSEEVVWHPKEESNPDYHYREIVAALKKAASAMPRVDGIGISSAGIYVDNQTMVASLFLRVSAADFEAVVKDIYINTAAEIGDVPLYVANDGDVTAFAGAMELGEGKVLGIAMGTSLAAGYIDGEGNITGRLNELAFAPVDCKETGAIDEWSGDTGCGVKYLSQDAVVLLADRAAIPLPQGTAAEKLTHVQQLLAKDDRQAEAVFCGIGCYLGHSLAFYRRIYELDHVLLLGRVMSGKAGTIILDEARRVLDTDYPDLSKDILLHLPSEQSRRLGQSVAAAALPRIE